MTLLGQGEPIRTKLLKPHKFGQDKDHEAEPYKADQNDGGGLYYVIVNLCRGISQSHNLETSINTASTKVRSGSPNTPLPDLQAQGLVQEALELTYPAGDFNPPRPGHTRARAPPE